MIINIFILLASFSLVMGQGYGRMIAPGSEIVEEEGQQEESTSQSTAQFLEWEALEKAIDPDSYILGPGDEIGLDIVTSEVFTYALRLTPTGGLFIPAAGVCDINGLTISEGNKVVNEFVRKHAFPSAQSHMVLLNPRKFKLQVVGAVNKPGFATISPLTRLNEVVEQMEGFHQFAKEYEIQIHRKSGKVESINYHDYQLSGNLEANPTFYEGDKVVIPFGKIDESGIVVRGSIEGTGYDIISPDESLATYIQRKVIFKKDTDLKNVTITREVGGDTENIFVDPASYERTILQAGDVLNFMWERGVMVTGFVQDPGGFNYFPGFTVGDYIALAGGNSEEGNAKKATTLHLDGGSGKGLDAAVDRGDIIFVPRTRKDVLIGDMSVLAVVTGVLTIYLTYLRAGS